ncbi:beta-galactosidase [Candidatus Epulonipiscium viviparus]|uniref:beta-galactosidase n=1 Tax=Candidatus Epulonipiscium viviparus TaxID=420336 RepID=UPI002738142E|nr:beta-galactosidase [Candidatus Epulopiscium viviparus]
MKKFIAGLAVALCTTPAFAGSVEHDFYIDTDLNYYGSSMGADAQQKLAEFKVMVDQARDSGIEVTREETVIEAAELFIKGATWDQANTAAIKQTYEKLWFAKPNAAELAKNMPSYQFFQVYEMLEEAQATLEKVIDGTYTRRDVPQIDWTQVHLDGSNYTYDGNVVFPFNYTWEDNSMGGNLLGNADSGYIDFGITFKSATTLNTPKLDERLFNQNPNISSFMLGHKNITPFMKAAHPEATAKGFSDYVAYDRNDPAMLDYLKRMIDVAVTTNAELGRNLDLGYTLANEPHWVSAQGEWYVNQGKEGNISAITMQKFRNYLATVYSDIASLNANWNTNFADFSSVELEVPLDPAIEGTPPWYDYITFHKKDVTEFFTFMHNEILAIDPSAQTSIKLIPEYFINTKTASGLDFEALTELTTLIGDDSGISQHRARDIGADLWWDDVYAYDWITMALPYDFMWSVAPNKAHVNTENHIISRTLWIDIKMNPQLARSAYWLQSILGLDASQFWVWGRSADGALNLQKLGSALLGSSSQLPAVTNEIAQTAHDLNAFGAEVAALQSRKRPIRIFHSETTVTVESSKVDSVKAIHEKMYFSEAGVGFVTPNIIAKQDNDDWSTILVYDTPYVTDAEFEALQNYLDNGGNVIIDEASLKFNEYKVPRTTTLVGDLTIVSTDDDTLSNMHAEAFEVLVAQGTNPVITATEANGFDQKTAFIATAPLSENEYVMSITQLGKNPGKITLSATNGKKIASVVDLFTGQKLSTIILRPENMKFLKVILN